LVELEWFGVSCVCMMRRREKCYTRERKGVYIDVGQVK
jgi:hypothetical protein